MSNFICEKCGMTNIDCGHQGYKTEREIELEKQLDREIKINRKLVKTLKEYAKLKPMNVFTPGKLYMPSQGEMPYDLVDIAEKARKVLKEIDNKE